MLSNTCKYAIRAVIYLGIHSKDGKKIRTSEISEKLDIPSPFLGKIMQLLSKKKLLVSSKGPNGGFSLARDTFEISLLDIVEVIDGLDVFNICLIGLRICSNNPSHRKLCPFHEKGDKLRDDLKKLFKEETIGRISENLVDIESIINI